MLDETSGRETPLAAGDYIMCPQEGDEENSEDCERFSVTIDETGLYFFLKEDEEPANLRFRRVGRKGYAIQSYEGEDSFQYYYGRGDSNSFRMTMMQCASLPERLRDRLISDGGLETDDSDFETCTVTSLKALDAAARAYHRRNAVDDEEIATEITPAPPIEDEGTE